MIIEPLQTNSAHAGSDGNEIELSIVVPTYNEKSNIGELCKLVDAALVGIKWELIFVDDDSPDRTHEFAKKMSQADHRIRCIRRIGRRGLSGACIEGILSSSAPYVAVMDADLQHDERILPKMLHSLKDGVDIAIGTRYLDGDKVTTGFSNTRQWGSSFATKLAKTTLAVQTTDPMSGFFMLNRSVFESIAPLLSKDGFKLLLDILASTEQPLNISEHAYQFRSRLSGESKLDTLVTLDYLGLLLSKVTGGFLPVRFFLFAAVGLSGVFVHLLTLNATIHLTNQAFSSSQLIATMVAMTWNYALNNQLTFRDRRLRGIAYIRGLFIFYAACSVGTVANVGASSWIYGFDNNTMLAGVAGALIGSVFNYATTSIFTWKR
jgi:dolichol-phosphate mannosyltransferase